MSSDDFYRRLHNEFARRNGIKDLKGKVKQEIEDLVRMEYENPSQFKALAEELGGVELLREVCQRLKRMYLTDNEGSSEHLKDDKEPPSEA